MEMRRMDPRDLEQARCGPLVCKRKLVNLGLIVLISVVLFADQNLLAPVLTPVAREFGWVERYENGTVVMELDDNLGEMVAKVDAEKRDAKLGGEITLAFFMIGGVVSLVVGYLTDTVNRLKTFAVVVIIGELGCLATIFVKTYTGLLITRAITGVGIGGAIPLMYSLFGDMFSVETRGKAVAAAGVAMGLGVVGGQVMAGPIAGPDGSRWRWSFVAVAIPAFILVGVLLVAVKEPPRGGQEEALRGQQEGDEVVDYSEKLTWKKFRSMVSTPTIVLAFFQGIPGSLPWGVMLGFFNDFLVEEKNVDRSVSGLIVSAFGLGAGIGTLIGGFLSDALRDKKRFIPVAMSATTILGAIPIWILINIPPQEVFVYMLLSFPSGVIIGVTGSAVKVVLVNVSLPETRGSVFSIFNLFDDLGKGFGTFGVSLIIKAAGDRGSGLTYSLIGWIACGMINFFMYFTIERDYTRSQDQLMHSRPHSISPADLKI